MPSDPMTLATDADREQAVAVLTSHVGAGRLSLSDFDERAAAAYAARTLGDLEALLSDLPGVPRPSLTIHTPRP